MIDFNDPQIRYLIDYVNLKQNMIKYQTNFLNQNQFNKFKKKKRLGFPLVLPEGIKFFNYNKKKYFFLEEYDVLKNIFGIKKKNYIGMQIFFRFGNKFYYDVNLKKKYHKEYKYIFDYNQKLIKELKKLKKNFYISSFQTRNIPHLGHEKIIKILLSRNGLVFINPLIGLKKKGDCKNVVLEKVYKKLINFKPYNERLLYKPVIANMHYGGPREAIHHINLREMLGFDRFTVGRDHAGAENAYNPLSALKTAKKEIKNYKIDVFFHKGSYFCKKCNLVVIKNDCVHKNFIEISGTEFRNKLNKKKYFKFASKPLQAYVHQIKSNIFYK